MFLQWKECQDTPFALPLSFAYEFGLALDAESLSKSYDQVFNSLRDWATTTVNFKQLSEPLSAVQFQMLLESACIRRCVRGLPPEPLVQLLGSKNARSLICHIGPVLDEILNDVLGHDGEQPVADILGRHMGLEGLRPSADLMPPAGASTSYQWILWGARCVISFLVAMFSISSSSNEPPEVFGTEAELGQSDLAYFRVPL